MTKKNFLFTLALVAMLPLQQLQADPIPLPLQVKIDNPINNEGGHRSPVLVPVFYLDGYTLTASSYTVGSTVELKDEDDNAVFSTYIYIEGDIQLPTTLSGIFTIEVTRGSMTFIGEIEL